MLNLFEHYKPYQGIYIHIPHCLQKCHYCDFPTVLLDQGPDLDHYTSLIEQELELKILKDNTLSSVYFGGGTPSLIGPERIQRILEKINSLGYQFRPNCEITIEINPGTLSSEQIDALRRSGVNRFSIGVQTFNDSTLKTLGREHNAKQSIETLDLIKSAGVPFTADLILALPGENFSEFKKNATTLLNFNPNHLSVYVLTVPENNFLAQNMPKEDLLDELMDESENFLSLHNFERYEISNYRKKDTPPSLHNLLYWNDLNYWGVGMGAHSYLKDYGPWGLRFWNPRIFSTYEKQLNTRSESTYLPPKGQSEVLQLNESLTDFCFTHLRQWQGISEQKLDSKYGLKIKNLIVENLQKLEKDGYIDNDHENWRLSKYGRKFADHVFRQLCFSKQEMEVINER